MIDAHVTGKLYGKPGWHTSRAGLDFVAVKLVARTSGGSLYVNVVAFDEEPQAALLALDAGDSVTIIGPLKASAYTDRKGDPHPSLDVAAQSVLTLRQARRKRRNSQPKEMTP
jgi:single-stranded DNA-binding protein